MDLSRNALGDKGAKALAAGGAFRGNLASLNLFYNHIGSDGAEAIAAAIAASGSMPKKLILRYNDISIRGAQALANAITSIEAVASVQVDLQSNSVTRREWRACWDAGVAAIERLRSDELVGAPAQSLAMAEPSIRGCSATHEDSLGTGYSEPAKSRRDVREHRLSFINDHAESQRAPHRGACKDSPWGGSEKSRRRLPRGKVAGASTDAFDHGQNENLEA